MIINNAITLLNAVKCSNDKALLSSHSGAMKPAIDAANETISDVEHAN